MIEPSTTDVVGRLNEVNHALGTTHTEWAFLWSIAANTIVSVKFVG